MVQPRFNARADLQRLVERRMLQLVGAGLRCASSCCSLPPLAGYRLDRLKQDFAVSTATCVVHSLLFCLLLLWQFMQEFALRMSQASALHCRINSPLVLLTGHDPRCLNCMHYVMGLRLVSGVMFACCVLARHSSSMATSRSTTCFTLS
jgi:hypothetical protein